MYFELAKKNIKNNLKDYILYFSTITAIVSIFFAFTSTDVANYILNLLGGLSGFKTRSMVDTKVVISALVMIGLAIIIIYSNSFFIKRRKKEIGVCLSLGMSKKSVAGVLFLEAILIAIIALVIGIIGGVVLSQLILFGMLHTVGLGITDYKFIFSLEALIETVVYFIGVFIVVGIINMSFASKKISNTLTERKKGSFLLQKKLVTSIITLIIGIIAVCSTYYIWMLGNLERKQGFFVNGGMAIISTIIFMIGLVNIIIHITSKNEKVFLKGINIFSVCQLKANINRIIITSIITSSLLFISMFGIVTAMQSQKGLNLQNIMPGVDATIAPIIGINSPSDFAYIMDNSGANKEYDYTSRLNIDLEGNVKVTGDKGHRVYDSLSVMTLDWYNKYMKMIGKPEVKLGQNQTIIIANNEKSAKYFNGIGKKQSFEFAGKTYKDAQVQIMQNYQNNYQPDQFTIILPVKISILNEGSHIKITENGKEIPMSNYKLNGWGPMVQIKAKKTEYNTVKAYKSLSTKLDKFISNKEVQKKLDLDVPIYTGPLNNFMITSVVGERLGQTQNKVISGFTSGYIGIIFLVGSVILVGLQILIETSEEKEKYGTLKNIGVNEKEINSNLLKQIIIRFAIPFIFAGVNFVVFSVAWGFGRDFMNDFNLVPITLVLTLIIYILYTAITYAMAKKVIKK